jgi:hypothetical protein
MLPLRLLPEVVALSDRPHCHGNLVVAKGVIRDVRRFATFVGMETNGDRCQHLDIGFECWLLDIEISENSENFSDAAPLGLDFNGECFDMTNQILTASASRQTNPEIAGSFTNATPRCCRFHSQPRQRQRPNEDHSSRRSTLAK